MDSPAVIFAGRWLIRDTFCQALTSRVFWLMLAASTVCIIFCLGIGIDGPRTLRPDGETELGRADNQPLTGANPHPGHMTMLFGLFQVDLFRDAEWQVHFLQVVFSSWIAGVVGILLGLLWTAGFVPESLQPNVAAVQMTRPTPRWVLLLGKYLGVVVFVTFQAAVFFGGTWMALGLKTGIWLPSYLLGIPLLVLHFAAFYSVSTYLATVTRSTMASAFGSILFWVVCLGVNYGRYAVMALPQTSPSESSLSAVAGKPLEVVYWVLPKPADFLLILEHALDMGKHRATLSSMPEFHVALSMGGLNPTLSLLSVLLFIAAMIALGSRQLRQSEY